MYPAASPNVVGVGGTSLTLNASGGYGSETTWNLTYPSGQQLSSGGGTSTIESQPAYQQGVEKSQHRTVPDVSYNTGPNGTPTAGYTGNGYSVYDSYNNGTSSPWETQWGTSAGAPQWAGLIALTDQIRSSEGLPALTGSSQTLPYLYSLPSSDFHDITTGSNQNGISAGPGYDQVTGIGSPVANLMIGGLVHLTLTAGQAIHSPNGQYELVMQSDGNLVEYGPNHQVIWDSETNGHAGAYAVMQLDGNLVVYSSTNQALWASGTSGNLGAYLELQNNGNAAIYQSNGTAIWSVNSIALPGRTLTAGQAIYSPNGQYVLVMQSDGNLVDYGPGGQVIWAAGTYGHAGAFAAMQGDGNLVVYSSTGQALWDAGTYGNPGAYLELQNNGNTAIYQINGTAIWSVSSIVLPGRTLTAGQAIYSPNGQYVLVMQSDGNLVEYGPNHQAIWASGTSGHAGAFAVMQGDGNLVVYSSTGQALWNAGTYGHPAPTSSSPIQEHSRSCMGFP